RAVSSSRFSTNRAPSAGAAASRFGRPPAPRRSWPVRRADKAMRAVRERHWPAPWKTVWGALGAVHQGDGNGAMRFVALLAGALRRACPELVTMRPRTVRPVRAALYRDTGADLAHAWRLHGGCVARHCKVEIGLRRSTAISNDAQH